MITPLFDRAIRPLAALLHEGHMRRLGIARTMRLARAYNRLKFGRQDLQRRTLYETEFKNLLHENGPVGPQTTFMKDGWAIDTTGSLPHLQRVLDEADQIIADRQGERRSSVGAYRSYFQDVWRPEDAVRFPSVLDFATSSELLAVVGSHLRCVPALSATLPAGIRFVESNAAFDDRPNEPHDSQLYHVDYYSLPNVYVLVLLRDTTIEHGPWTFLPHSVSGKVARTLRNWERGVPYRFTDEQVYAVADRAEAIEFSFPRGTVLFIESSGCFHYGSRNSVKPRFQLMLGYTGACRTDFSEVLMKPKLQPVRESDSRLRKWVLDRNRLE